MKAATLSGKPVVALLAALLTLTALQPGPVKADAADFQGMPGMWKVNYQIQRPGHSIRSGSYWFCADDGSDPMDTFAVIALPELENCSRASSRRSTTALAWQLSCEGGRKGRGYISFDNAEHYLGGVALPARHEAIQLEARHYAACTGPSD
ncbi:hypothetical protein [Frateuria aurantia]|uniref:Uncharacterized protein n=1 Tax=Frateuria aurantia (strain ATCC 33424 / DSM 6220 / KCTC 2777 / LMG 1558 / NBRC 3245 / NCIMB 13370) TaxID=767434 RepID=H8L4T2_FRAAD|nr:hypothetical protein [Frateuria aurantia]AFC85005.1 Protein of unknown function (DUF3617) [Frateuria aurantia DSM 6220]